MARFTPFLAAIIASCGGLACAADNPDRAALFTRLGGASAVDAIASDTLDAAVKADASVAANLPAAKQQLSQYICARAGGGCEGTQTSLELRSLVEPLRAALRAHNIPLAARNELLEVLAAARRDLARR